MALLGDKADPLLDSIEVDGKRLSPGGEPLCYILLNKPKGYICSLHDPEGRPLVIDLLKKIKARVYPVGRLDYDAEGVLLLTNDGGLSNTLMHPAYSAPKTYLVKVRDVPDEKDMKKLRNGVTLPDGKTLPAKVRLVRKTKENSWLEIIVTEGRNRLIKRMCMAVGHPVNKIKRIDFAGIGLGGLEPGQFRHLTKKEVQGLKES